MTQVNMLEAKTNRSKLVKMLETGQEEVSCPERNETADVQIPLISKPTASKRIGAAEGKFKVHSEFDAWDKEINETFGGDQ